MERPPSEQTIECFTHGLAHLITEFGYEKGLAVAGGIVLDLVEGSRADLPIDRRGPVVPRSVEQ